MQKTPETRKHEVKEIRNRINELGIPESLSAIQKLYILANDFEQNGYGSSGKIKIPEYNRVIYYKFCLTATVPSELLLKQV